MIIILLILIIIEVFLFVVSRIALEGFVGWIVIIIQVVAFILLVCGFVTIGLLILVVIGLIIQIWWWYNNLHGPLGVSQLLWSETGKAICWIIRAIGLIAFIMLIFRFW